MEGSDSESGPEIVEVSPYDAIELTSDDDEDDDLEDVSSDTLMNNDGAPLKGKLSTTCQSPEMATQPKTSTQKSKPSPSAPSSPSDARTPSKALIDQLVSEEINSRGSNVTPTEARRIRRMFYNREYKRLNQDRLKQREKRPESIAKAKIRNARGKQNMIAKHGLEWYLEKQRQWNRESRARRSEQQREAKRKRSRAYDATVRAQMKELAQKGDIEAIAFFEHKKKLNQDWHKRMYETEDAVKRAKRLEKIRARYQRMKRDHPEKYREKIRKSSLRKQNARKTKKQQQDDQESN